METLSYWLFTTEWPPFPGGIGTYAAQVAQAMARNGAEVHVFFFKESADSAISSKPEETLPNLHLHTFGKTTPFTSKFIPHAFTGFGQAAYAFQTAINEAMTTSLTRPDLVEFQDYGGVGYFVLLDRELKGNILPSSTKIAVTLHNPSFNIDAPNPYKLPDYFVAVHEQFALRHADILFAPSAYIGEKLGDSRGDRVCLLPHAFDFENRVKALRDRRNGRFGFFGRVQEHKGIYDLLNMFEKVWHRHNFFRPLTIFGKDSIHKHLNTSNRLFINTKYSHLSSFIDFFGAYDSSTLPDCIKHIDYAILPYREESFSFSFCEMMKHYVPTFLTVGGGQAELCHPSYADIFIFDCNDFDDFVRKVRIADDLTTNELSEIMDKQIDYVASKTNPKFHAERKVAFCRQSVSRLENTKSIPRAFDFGDSLPAYQVTQWREEPSGGATAQAEVSSVAAAKPHAKHPLLSVIVPFYNMGQYLPITFGSILQSSYPNVEVIIVDDGSTDINSLRELEDTENEYPEICRVHRMENAGLATARNVGASLARGKYIAFLDPDDAVDSGYFSRAIAILEDFTNIGFVGCWAQQFDEGNAIWPTWPVIFPYHLYHNMINSSAIVVNASLFRLSGQNDADLIYGMEDYEATLRMSLAGGRGVAIPYPLFFHRARSGSMSNIFSQSSMQYLYRIIRNKHTNVFSAYANELLGLTDANGFGANVVTPFASLGFSNHWSDCLAAIKRRFETSLAGENTLDAAHAGVAYFDITGGMDPEFCLALIKVLIESNTHTEIVKKAATCIESNTESSPQLKGWLHFHLAEYLLAIGQFDSAADSLEKAWKVIADPAPFNWAAARFRDGYCGGFKRQLGAAGGVAAAAAIVTFLKSTCPRSPDISQLFVDMSLQLGRINQEVIQEAIFAAEQKEDFWANFHATRVFFRAMDWGKAEFFCRRALVAKDAEPLAFLSEMTLAWNERAFQRAIKVSDIVCSALQGSAILRRQGAFHKWSDGVLSFVSEQFTELACAAQERKAGADICETILMIDPRKKLANFFTARHRQLDLITDRETARRLMVALKQDPHDTWVRLHLAKALIDLHHPAPAMSLLREGSYDIHQAEVRDTLLQLDENDPTARTSLAKG